jgi:hypothetical protein
VSALAGAGLIEHVTLLGKQPEPEDERAWQQFAIAMKGKVSWRKQFDLSAADVSRELAEHDCGLLANEADILTKSGVFAALAAHGVIPVVAGGGTRGPSPAFDRAVLINDESGESTTAVLEALANPAACRERREQLLAFVRARLAWPRITESWNAMLGENGVPLAARQNSGTHSLRRDEREAMTHP